MNKTELFIQNARILSEKLGIVPLLYGSVGLEYLTGEDIGADDIDILIPRVYITEKWAEFKALLEAHGYTLTDEREHTFIFEGESYSYADIEDLESYIRVDISNIKVYEECGVRFMVLGLDEYLAVYERSQTDGYRVNVRKKKDDEKIKFIKGRKQQ